MQDMALKTTARFGFLLFGLEFVGVAQPTLHWDMSKFEPSSSEWAEEHQVGLMAMWWRACWRGKGGVPVLGRCRKNVKPCWRDASVKKNDDGRKWRRMGVV